MQKKKTGNKTQLKGEQMKFRFVVMHAILIFTKHRDVRQYCGEKLVKARNRPKCGTFLSNAGHAGQDLKLTLLLREVGNSVFQHA